MKKPYIILFVLLAINSANAQDCLPEGIYFSSQAQVDSFQINYPGCTKIEGNVSISQEAGNNPITNLNGLSVLTSIGGDLFYGATAVSDFTGLDNLTSIGGNLYLTYPPDSLNGLDNLTTIGGDLVIGSDVQFFYGTILTSLMGLHSLTFIGGDLKILKNNVLENLSGLENLTTIGGGIRINRNYSLSNLSGMDNIKASSITSMYICNNTSLSSCNVQSICNYLASPNGTVDIHTNAEGCSNPAQIATGCGISLPCLPYGNYWFFTQDEIDHFKTDYQGCTEVKGNVTITGNDVTSVIGLNQVTSIGGDLLIGAIRTPFIGNPELTSLTGLENLNHIGGNLYISCDDSLVSLTGLDNLTSTGDGLYIGLTLGGGSRNMEALTSIKALGNLTSVGGELYITNTALINLSGLDSVSSVGGGITIYSNNFLSSISSLAKIPSINGEFKISYTAISSLTGLENVSAIGGNVRINHNTDLKNLAGLNTLTSIGGSAWIYSNDSLTNMTGLHSLASIGGDLDLWDNSSLVSLSGLEKLESIGGYFRIGENALTNLADLSGLHSISGDLYIGFNPSLNTLSGLDSLNSNTITNLTIRDNLSLSTCEAQSICDFLVTPNGNVTISNNSPGCNSQEEVKTACGVGHKILLDLAFTAVDSAAYVQLDSIRVMNRTQGGDTLIYWPNTTLTVEITPGDHLLYVGYSTRYPYGISDINSIPDDFTLLQNYPNPVTDQGTVSLFIPEKGKVNLLVTDIWGKKIINTAFTLGKGFHSFRFVPDDGNLFFITARWNGISRSIKVLSTGSASGKRCSLDYTGTSNEILSSYKSSFNTGLVIQESGLLDSPEVNKTYTLQFATHIPCPGTPVVTYGGQVYNTVQIFSQCWLKENLNVGTMIPGTQGMSNNSMNEKYCYNNEVDSCTKYGGLYQWNEMMQYTTQQGARGICPPGWHLPTDEEWKVLEGAVDSQYGIGDNTWDILGYGRGIDAGTNLKTTSGWHLNGNGTDLFGFSGLPGGGRHDNGNFLSTGGGGDWWTSTESDNYLAWYRNLGYGYPEVYRNNYYYNKDYGFSVRCLRDN